MSAAANRAEARQEHDTVGWFRAYRQWGAAAALFALVLQFALSFAHIHGLDPLKDTAPVLTAAAADGIAAPAPGEPKKPALAFDFCVICAVTSLAAHALPAGAPGLPLPVLAAATPLLPGIGAVVTTAPSRLFQARAPPAA
jgi:hypothetical protein